MQNYSCDILQYYPLKIDKSKDRLRSKYISPKGETNRGMSNRYCLSNQHIERKTNNNS